MMFPVQREGKKNGIRKAMGAAPPVIYENGEVKAEIGIDKRLLTYMHACVRFPSSGKAAQGALPKAH